MADELPSGDIGCPTGPETRAVRCVVYRCIAEPFVPCSSVELLRVRIDMRRQMSASGQTPSSSHLGCDGVFQCACLFQDGMVWFRCLLSRRPLPASSRIEASLVERAYEGLFRCLARLNLKVPSVHIEHMLQQGPLCSNLFRCHLNCHSEALSLSSRPCLAAAQCLHPSHRNTDARRRRSCHPWPHSP